MEPKNQQYRQRGENTSQGETCQKRPWPVFKTKFRNTNINLSRIWNNVFIH